MSDPNRTTETHNKANQRPICGTIGEALVVAHKETFKVCKPYQGWEEKNQVRASYIHPHINHHEERRYAHPLDEDPSPWKRP